jgi:hypothetical protein
MLFFTFFLNDEIRGQHFVARYTLLCWTRLFVMMRFLHRDGEWNDEKKVRRFAP